MMNSMDLLQSVKNSSDDIAFFRNDSTSYASLYYFSDLRNNLVSFLPIKSSDRVLILNAECCNHAIQLSKRCAHVIAIEADPNLCEIAKIWISQEHINNCDVICDRPEHFLQHQNEDIKFDWIVLVEDSGICIYNEPSIARKIRMLLSADGRFCFAIENKLGIKYWAGCQEPYQGGYFVGIENYVLKSDGPRCMSRKEIEIMIRSAGFEQMDYCYPYPDHLFTTEIYSDERLPQVGELNKNNYNFDESRYLFFDEAKAFDTVIKENLFTAFSNSYLVIAH